ncbi:MAG: hypothetical protein JWN14_4179 [Chthonomonadales bacterium]|nr:hypothetical protein [Chthonomonadales bacterium]
MKKHTFTSRHWLLAIPFLSLAVLPQTVFAQEKSDGGDLETLFSGKSQPISLKMKDLDSAVWRRVKISGGSEKKEDGGLAGMLGSMFGGGAGGGEGMGGMMSALLGPMFSGVSTAGPNVYYTRGKTVVLGSETYLVAYQPQIKDLDFAALMKMKDMAAPPTPKPLTPETLLVMSLLNLHTIGNLSNIQPFNLQTEITESETAVTALAEIAKEQETEKKDKNLFDPEEAAPAPAKPAPPKAKPVTPKKKPSSAKRSG